jgi:hypothetical protein
MLTDDEIRALLEGTKGVTPGPWVAPQNRHYGFYVGRAGNPDADPIACDCNTDEDAAHIARCDPTTIAELCTRLLSAEAQLADCRGRHARTEQEACIQAENANREKLRADRAEARVRVLEDAGSALIADVKRRHPGEELRCQFMRALDAALQEQST